MADKPAKFEPDVVAALKLVIGVLHSMGASLAMGVHRNVALAAALLEPPPEEEVVAETPAPGDDKKAFPAKVAS